MPLYEYECPKGHRFEMLRPMDRRKDPVRCSECHGIARLVVSLNSWKMGFEFLEAKSEKSPPAPEDAGYYPEWDEAYAPL